MGKIVFSLGLFLSAACLPVFANEEVPPAPAAAPAASTAPSTALNPVAEVPTANPDFVPELLDRSSWIGALDQMDPTVRLAGENEPPTMTDAEAPTRMPASAGQ